MAKITGILPSDESAETVVEQLSKLQIDNLDWRVVTPQEDTDRIIPAVGWHTTGASGSTGVPMGLPIVTDYPEDEVLADRGVDPEDAEPIGRAAEQGGTLIVIDVADSYENEIRAILEAADVQMIASD